MEFEILHMIQSLHREWLSTIMILLSFIGEYGMCWIAVSLVLVIFPKTRQCGIAMMIGMAVSFLVGNVLLKNIIGRARPFIVDTSIPLLVPFPSEYSFPSGHTINSFTAAVTIFLYYKKWGVLALIGAALIAFSRLYLFVHYPTDILGGMILGTLVACLVVRFLRDERKENIL